LIDTTSHQLLGEPREEVAPLPSNLLRPPDRLIQGVQHLGDAGLLSEVWRRDGCVFQDALGKATAPPSRGPSPQFFVSEVEVVEEVVLVKLTGLSSNQSNGLIGAEPRACLQNCNGYE
jgi:hypothetical protein